MGYYEEALAAFRRGETDVVERLSRDELDRARASADAGAEVAALGMLARAAIRGGDLPGAAELAAEARSVARGTGDRRLEQAPLHIQAGCARLAGDVGSARALLRESIALNESLGEARMAVVDQYNLAFVELHEGDVAAARELFAAACEQTLARFDTMLDSAALGAAGIAAADGDAPRAARLLGAADALYRAREEIPDPDDALEHEALRGRLITGLGQGPFDAEYARGAALDLRRELAR